MNNKTKQKKNPNFVSFPVANPYLHNASRTNKTSSSGIVREAQREANTDMKEKVTKQNKTKKQKNKKNKQNKNRSECGDPRAQGEDGERVTAGSLRCLVTSGGKFGNKS